MSTRRIGKYELRELLGRGGMAEVWKAFDPQLERYVAVKLLHADLQSDPEFMSRFTREAKVIASLHHPNIVQIHDFQVSRPPESDSPTAYMVMDYVEGQTLAGYIRNTSRLGKFLPAEQLVRMFASICQAVDYAHQHGVIHRDIKPSNILLDQRNTRYNPMGEPVLTDFGIVKLMGATSTTLAGTRSGVWLGTPLYISPEQAQGHPATERSDIYSLGVILYEVCTGVPPFRGESMTGVMMQHINAMPPPPALINPHIPPALALVILNCLAKNPNERFSSASAMLNALAEALEVPLPSDMQYSTRTLDAMSQPTYLSPVRADPSQAALASSPSSLSPAAAPAQSGSMTPAFSAPASSIPVGEDQNRLVMTPSQTPLRTTPSAFPTPPAPPQRRRRRGLFLVLAAALLVVLLGSGLGAFYWLTHPIAPTNQIVGHAYFISSGEVSEQSNQGINDELLIDLHNIPAPDPGKSYYAWLLSDESNPEGPALLLGKLPITQETVHFLYAGDVQHTNLLGITSRLLITQEDANTTPISPSPDKSAWRYFAEIPQQGNPMDMAHASVLLHLRHLLVDVDTLKAMGLPGGLDLWLFRNTEKVFEWAAIARDFWASKDAAGVHNQLVRMLDYLDGVKNVQQDIHSGVTLLVNPTDGAVSLLGSGPMNMSDPMAMETSGYLFQVDQHLTALTQAPGFPQEKRTLAAQIDQEIINVRNWLEQVHKYAVQLVNLPTPQLLTQNVLLTLDYIATQARYAYIGQINADTDQVQGGVVQIHDNIQHLATYDIAAYTS